MFHVVIEGRSRLLEGVNLHDPSTYGVEWMALDAVSAEDAARQWRLFKAGRHPFQSRLEAEASGYRTAGPGVRPPWQAEPSSVGSPDEAGRETPGPMGRRSPTRAARPKGARAARRRPAA
jgi:hypothetical protein